LVLQIKESTVMQISEETEAAGAVDSVSRRFFSQREGLLSIFFQDYKSPMFRRPGSINRRQN
jgi:hypothetical protein